MRFPLPSIKTVGAVIRATRDTFNRREPVVVEVGATMSEVVVTLTKRETVLGRQTIGGCNERMQTVAFDLAGLPTADGVLIATVWNLDGQPLAERLLFRQPAKQVLVSTVPRRQDLLPGGKAKLNVKTTDETGTPTSAVVGLTVTDDSVLEMIEKREQSPRLPVMVFLESEVRELADAHVYLDPHNEKAEWQWIYCWERRLAAVCTRRLAEVCEQHDDQADARWRCCRRSAALHNRCT